MKKKSTEQERAVATVKAQLSPSIPCVNADEEGYCTGPCEGSLCCKCPDYKPRATGHEPSAEPSALTVRACDEITFPPGVETLGEKANFLHAYSIEASKRSTGAAILAGWVLSVARSTCAHGQWLGWLQQNVNFTIRTANNYLTLYAQTVGARRAEMRRPIPLTTPPTADELEAAAHDVDGKALSALYKSTRLIAAPANWGGAGRGQGRKPRDAEKEAAELDAIANNPALLFAAVKGPLDELWRLHRERDVFARLGDEELRDVVNVLQPLYKCAAGVLEDRMRSKGFPTI